jgi:hypothetical protein
MIMPCIAGAIIAACNPTATIAIDGPVAYAPQVAPQYAWNYATYAQPIQTVRPLVILRRA